MRSRVVGQGEVGGQGTESDDCRLEEGRVDTPQGGEQHRYKGDYSTRKTQ